MGMLSSPRIRGRAPFDCAGYFRAVGFVCGGSRTRNDALVEGHDDVVGPLVIQHGEISTRIQRRRSSALLPRFAYRPAARGKRDRPANGRLPDQFPAMVSWARAVVGQPVFFPNPQPQPLLLLSFSDDHPEAVRVSSSRRGAVGGLGIDGPRFRHCFGLRRVLAPARGCALSWSAVCVSALLPRRGFDVLQELKNCG